MPELIDCHVHTSRCGHATGNAIDYVQAARERGISTLVFAEHMPLPEEFDQARRLSLHPDDLAIYAEEILRLASDFSDIKVILGLEIDWLPGYEEYTAEMIERARALGVSVLLGSVHFLDGWAFDDPHQISRWDERDVDSVYDDYFETWCQAAQSGMFDIMAHPDLPKKFGHRPVNHTDSWYVEAARCAAATSTAVEVSTAGLRKPVNEMYPAPELLAKFFAAGVEVTVGSDAHSPAEVGHSLEVAYSLVSAVGYGHVVCPDGDGKWRLVQL